MLFFASPLDITRPAPWEQEQKESGLLLPLTMKLPVPNLKQIQQQLEAQILPELPPEEIKPDEPIQEEPQNNG